MKKIINLIAVIIFAVLMVKAISVNVRERRLAYDYTYIPNEVDKRLTKKAQAICNAYGGVGRKVKVKFDLEPLSKGWNAYTTKLSDGTYLIVTSNETDKTLYHEIAHVLTFEEDEIHGPSWKMMLTKMGYPKEAAHYRR